MICDFQWFSSFCSCIHYESYTMHLNISDSVCHPTEGVTLRRGTAPVWATELRQCNGIIRVYKSGCSDAGLYVALWSIRDSYPALTWPPHYLLPLLSLAHDPLWPLTPSAELGSVWGLEMKKTFKIGYPLKLSIKTESSRENNLHLTLCSDMQWGYHNSSLS